MLRRPIAFVLLLCYLPACVSLRAEPGISAAEHLATQQPDTVWVTRTDGQRLVLEQPRITPGDSLAGLHRGAPARIALADIARAETRQFDAGTAGVFLVGAATLVLVFGFVALKESMSHANWGWD